MKKIERLLAIILALKKYGKLTASRLSQLLDVNIRTIYRDMDALSQMDVPIAAAPGLEGGYEIREDYFIPPISFTKEEILALSVGQRLLKAVSIPGFSQEIESAFLKLEDSYGHKNQTELYRTLEHILFDLAGSTPDQTGHSFFKMIYTALAKRQKLMIRYFSPNKLSESTREVEPWVLRFYDGCWYLYGLCCSRMAERTFRLDRIRELHLLDSTYVYPESFSVQNYDRILSYKNDIFPTPESTFIRLKMNQEFYERSREKLILKFYTPRVLDDGQLEIEVKTRYPQEFIDFAIKYNKEVVITEPEEIRTRLKQQLTDILNQY